MTTTEDYTDFYNEVPAEPCDYATDGRRFLPVLYSLFFVVGFPANMLVLWVILRGAQMKSMTDVCLLNLAIADLLLLITLPFLAHYAMGTWVFGHVMCTLVLDVYYIGFYAGIFFIVMMSIDRYLAIVHAVFALRIRSQTYGIVASMIIWIMAIAASFPELMYPGIEHHYGKNICSAYPKTNETHNYIRTVAFLKMNVLGLVIPLSVVIFCYSMVLKRLRSLRHSKKLAVHLVIVVMVVFFCCWTPYNIAAFLKALELMHILPQECLTSNRIQLLLQATEAVAYLHSCLNPFLYVFVGEKFRRHFIRLLRQTPFFHAQCLKRYMTQATGSVYSQTTSLDERTAGV